MEFSQCGSFCAAPKSLNESILGQLCIELFQFYIACSTTLINVLLQLSNISRDNLWLHSVQQYGIFQCGSFCAAPKSLNESILGQFCIELFQFYIACSTTLTNVLLQLAHMNDFSFVFTSILHCM